MMAQTKFPPGNELAISTTRWTRAKIADELLLLFRTTDINVDPETGHKRSKYEKQAEFILYRINIYKPAPPFILYTSDLNLQLEKELSCLDDESLDDVIRETIYRLLDELNTSDFKIDVPRHNIRWEIQK